MKALIIGGSAGAIETPKEILPKLPEERIFPVIIVLHLLPRGQSLLPVVFRQRCKWPVKEAESTEVIENGVIYFAPNDYHLSVESDRSFSLSSEEPIRYSRPSIDLFFKSASAVYKSELTAVLLSGANGDGSQGFLEILNRGGRCLAQAPETAEFPEMPTAALAISPDVLSLSPGDIVEFLHRRK